MTSRHPEEVPRQSSRRRFLRQSALVLAFAAGNRVVLASPAQARAQRLPLNVLSPTEADTLAVTAEALVPGAREAGIVHFIDQQLGAPAGENLLMLKYLGIPLGEETAFYRTALASIDALSRTRFERPAAALSADEASELARALAADDTPGWTGAPASFFHFVLRSDGVDVVYGTTAGFEHLEIPPMHHITAPQEW